MGDAFTVSNMFNLLLYVYLPMNNWKKLSFVSQAACVKYMLVLEVVPLPFAFKIFILDEYFDEIIYDYFFSKVGLGAQALSLNGFFTDFKGISWR